MPFYLEDFGCGDEESKCRRQGGRKYACIDQRTKARDLDQDLGIWAGNHINEKMISSVKPVERLKERYRRVEDSLTISDRQLYIHGQDSFKLKCLTWKLFERPKVQVPLCWHSVKFQPRPQLRPSHASVKFSGRLSFMFPEASRSTHAPAGQTRAFKPLLYDQHITKYIKWPMNLVINYWPTVEEMAK